jgi:hypothetical protein
MPVNVEGEPLWHDTIVAPADDDDIDGPSVADPVTLLQDNCRFLDERIFHVGWDTLLLLVNSISDTDPHDFPLPTPAEFIVPAFCPDATVQLSAQIAALNCDGPYSLTLVLYQSGSAVHVGAPNRIQAGHPSTCLAYFRGVDSGTYEVRVRVTMVSGEHTSGEYVAVINGLVIGGHPT